MNDEGEVFGAARLLDSITEQNPLPLSETIQSLMSDLKTWRGQAESHDDVSVLAVDVS